MVSDMKAAGNLNIRWTEVFYNPYRACRKFWTPRLRFSHHAVYGETPPATLARIAAFGGVQPEDTWLELGSGRGLGCAWVAEAVGCSAVGIEGVSSLYAFSRLFCKGEKVSFYKGNFFILPWPPATFVYAYTTVFREEELSWLAELACKFLPTGARIVTVSAPLPLREGLEEVGAFPVSYPWGETEAFIHKRL